ncbi:hypothetical protein FYJ78_03960 [Selenomonas sp. WCA-380-WT-3B 3/]|uniref:Integrase catalytic domain-containing protein n=1 Tax=Selenomonas montiformis TaxID=2652285 RepID=A0A6I2UYR7_9FIRM|nr:hypothetical protein [Selenomonas montiformis]
MSPRTPRHNGKVERSHRKDQERFYNHLRFCYGVHGRCWLNRLTHNRSQAAKEDDSIASPKPAFSAFFLT